MTPPPIRKLGTIDLDLVETTPIVFGEALYRLEYVRPRCTRWNATGEGFFRFVDVEADARGPAFAHGSHLGSAFARDGVMHVFGTDAFGGTVLRHWTSTDLLHWSGPETILDLPERKIYNTSCCHDGEQYVLLYERDDPDDPVRPFSFFFLVSDDAASWRVPGGVPRFGLGKPYCGGPTLDVCNGRYYLSYLAGSYEDGFATHLARSHDLRTWEESPYNPMLVCGEEDRALGHEKFSPAERERIAAAVNINASDVEYAGWRGRTTIYYSWGDQRGNEFLAEAESPVPLEQFFEGWFA